MSDIIRKLESTLHDAANAARLSVDAVERLGPHPIDPDGSAAAIFAADMAERLVRDALRLLSPLLKATP